MNASHTLYLPPAPAMRRSPSGRAAALCALAALLSSGAPARAADGCLVLLCLAAPSWHAIPSCVPPITQLLRDLARGATFPSCAMAGPLNSASNARSYAPRFCPPQYTRSFFNGRGPIYTCDFAGAISVTVAGAPFTRTWWSMGGDTSTEFTASAKAQLGSWNTRFDDDYAAWLRAQPSGPFGNDN